MSTERSPQTEVLRLMRNRLNDLQTRNPSYSVRAFAKKLGIGVSTTSMLLNGQRKASKKLIAQIADRLQFDPVEMAAVLPQIISKDRTALTKRGLSESIKISADQYQVVSEWHYLAILNLVRLKSFKADPAWIARRLAVTETKAAEAVDRLQRLGMLKTDGKNWVRSEPSYRTTDAVANTSLRKSHFQNLDLARRSLEQTPIELNDFSWLTMALKASRIPEMRQKIRKFQEEFADDFSYDADADEVYRLNVQLFPLTQTETPKKGKTQS